MEIIKFKIEVKKKGAQMVDCVTQMIYKDEIYLFPAQVQEISHHEILYKFPSIKAAVKALDKKGGHFRIPKVQLDDSILKNYFDDIRNPIFKDLLLECVQQQINMNDNSMIDMVNTLSDRFKKETQLKTKDAEKFFNIKNFEGKTNVNEFITSFELNCDKYGFSDDNQKIEILKFFLKDSAIHWYEANLKKLGSCWNDWKSSLFTVFGSRNFSTVRMVYNFKYLSGRFIDYALKKENLILDLDDKISDQYRIDLIVMGLPLSIQIKLNREKLISVDDLMKELSSLDLRKKDLKINETVPNDDKSKIQKKACSICFRLKKPNRFHPEHLCWFKNNNNNNKINLVENEEDFDYQKNE